jgi:hypothetical protein
MARVKEIIPQGSTLRFIQVGDDVFVQLPLGSTVFTNPTSSANSGNWITIYSQEMEIEYDDENEAKDSSTPAVGFVSYLGGRPRSR